MNLLEILQERIDVLPEGDYTPGLRAVLQHVQVAASHLKRGQSSGDDTAFTDAIYRTNQVFEGSLKEAYRVLTGCDPSRVSPSEIEKHLTDHKILRPRVATQLTNYRQNWRNPSTHDYRLDFDEDEALLAITSVAVFSVVLIDQIAERLSFERSKAEAKLSARVPDASEPLLERAATALEQFTEHFNQMDSLRFNIRESELGASLAGFLSTALGGIKAEPDAKLIADRHERADLLLESGPSRLIVEIKRTKPSEVQVRQGLEQLAHYMALSGIREAILYFYYSHNTGRIRRREHPLPGLRGRILVVMTDPGPDEAGVEEQNLATG